MNYVVIIFISFTVGFGSGWIQHIEFLKEHGIQYKNVLTIDESSKD